MRVVGNDDGSAGLAEERLVRIFDWLEHLVDPAVHRVHEYFIICTIGVQTKPNPSQLATGPISALCKLTANFSAMQLFRTSPKPASFPPMVIVISPAVLSTPGSFICG